MENFFRKNQQIGSKKVVTSDDAMQIDTKEPKTEKPRYTPWVEKQYYILPQVIAVQSSIEGRGSISLVGGSFGPQREHSDWVSAPPASVWTPWNGEDLNYTGFGKGVIWD